MTIDFANIPFHILNGVVQFIYTGKMEVVHNSLLLVLQVARQLRLNDLVDQVLKVSLRLAIRKSSPVSIL